MSSKPPEASILPSGLNSIVDTVPNGQFADRTVTPTLTSHGGYYAGLDGTLVSPNAPILPLEIRNVAVDVGRAVVEKLTGSVPDSARMMAAVDRSLNGQAR